GFSPSFYRTLISAARVGRVRVLVDTSGQALQVSLKARPFFIKPNLEEAEELLGHKLRNSNALVGALRAFVRMGAETAAISMGSNGLVWIEQRDGPVWFARPPQLKAISTVGSGDATVAGFAVAMSRGLKAEEAVRLAAACGAANCLARSPGRVALNDVTKLSPQVVVRRIA
ncbi:MAG TPA: PfkB family carbohydrate kinase, partial [Candidatus Acidoferrales bacterium]|nr:PfkB family carbohydrate kinase [Candidatus Acidoferrales bacterium]